MATRLSPEDLLPGEQSVDEFPASYFVVAAEWGVRAHGGGLFAGAFGIKGVEVVGGTLHLTSWRLVFASSRANRFTGSFSVSLADISGVENVSRGIKRAVVVSAGDRRDEFGMPRLARFLVAVEAQLDALDAAGADGADGADGAPTLAQAPPPRDPFRFGR